MKYEKHALRSTIKGEGKEGKTIGGKSIYFYDWMQLRRQRFSGIFSALFQADKKTIDKNSRQPTNQIDMNPEISIFAIIQCFSRMKACQQVNIMTKRQLRLKMFA